MSSLSSVSVRSIKLERSGEKSSCIIVILHHTMVVVDWATQNTRFSRNTRFSWNTRFPLKLHVDNKTKLRRLNVHKIHTKSLLNRGYNFFRAQSHILAQLALTVVFSAVTSVNAWIPAALSDPSSHKTRQWGTSLTSRRKCLGLMHSCDPTKAVSS